MPESGADTNIKVLNFELKSLAVWKLFKLKSSLRICSVVNKFFKQGLCRSFNSLESAGIWNVISRVLDVPWKWEFPLKNWLSPLIFVASFTSINNTVNSLKKYPKESLKKIVKENSWWYHNTKKCLVFGILGLVCIHACAVNVNVKLLENFYFSSW